MMPCVSHLQQKGLPFPVHDSSSSSFFLQASRFLHKPFPRNSRHVTLPSSSSFSLYSLSAQIKTSLQHNKRVRAQMASSLSPTVSTIFSTLNFEPHYRSHRLHLSCFPKKLPSLFISRSGDNGAGAAGSAVVEVTNLPEEEKSVEVKDKEEDSLSSNGVAVANAEVMTFKDPRWVGGTWDLMQFQKGGQTDWDAVIDAEARRRKWLEDNPEASSTAKPVLFDTSIVPWWAWVKRYHLPEAELLNGRAAMIGFFMAYVVDSLTGVGLVDQTNNFFCKILLLISVGGVMLIRKTEDIEKLKKLIEEATFYDRQWQATWAEDDKGDYKN